jgi:CBS domain-containing protein
MLISHAGGGMKAREIMTPNPACCTPETPAREVAFQMDACDCGCIPVVSDNGSRRLVGVVTDRDLAVRGLARGGDGETPVRHLMSREVSCCTPDSEAKEVERIMADRQVRRVPVVDDDGCCTGIIAQADLARRAERRDVREKELAEVVEAVSRRTSDSRADADIGGTRGAARYNEA